MEIKVNARKGGKAARLYKDVIKGFYRLMQGLHGKTLYVDYINDDDIVDNVRDYLFPRSEYGDIEQPTLYDIADQCLMNVEDLADKVVRKQMTAIGVMNYIDDSLPKMSDTEYYWMDVTDEARQVMLAKNDDYGEVWKEMLPTSLVDEILIKARRSRNLMQKHYAGEEAKVSEGILSELRDMINYCVFAHWAWSQEIKEEDSE